MVSAAIIGTALNVGLTAPDWSLWVDGSDVILGKLAPLEDIEVTENGPGGVSSMRFVVEDPTSVFTVQNGADVLYHNHTTDLPVFRGWVQDWKVTVFGVGRRYEVECVGVEVLLDWLVIPSLTIPSTSIQVGDAVQRMVAATAGIGVAMNTNMDTVNMNGSRDNPVGNGVVPGDGLISFAADIVLEGSTLREGLRQIIQNPTGITTGPTITKYTVDFWLGLRFVYQPTGAVTPSKPEDYADLTISSAGSIRPGGQDHELDGSGVVRGVYVKGGNAAGTGLLMDGTGLPGPIAVIEDATLLTDAAWRAVAIDYLNDNSEAARGSVRRETFTATDTVSAHVQVMSDVVITDAQIGLSAQTYEILQITKRFHGGNLETWTVGYGGMPPSLPRAIRRLTRDVLS